MEPLDWLAALEQSALAVSLRRSFIAYPIVNAAHILSIGVLVTSVLLIHGRRWALFGRHLDRDAFEKNFRRLALGAFTFATLTGFALFSIRATEYAQNQAFLLKLGLIAVAIVNFGLYSAQRTGRYRPVFAAGSTLLWLGALLAGRFIGFM